jgi:hypothetical protein
MMCYSTRQAIRIEDLDGPVRTVRLGDPDQQAGRAPGERATAAGRLIELTVLLAELARQGSGRTG